MEVTWKVSEWIWGQVGLREKGEPHPDAEQQQHCCAFTVTHFPLSNQDLFEKKIIDVLPLKDIWKTNPIVLRVASMLPFLLGFLWALQPHSTTSTPSTPTPSVPFAWGVWPPLPLLLFPNSRPHSDSWPQASLLHLSSGECLGLCWIPSTQRHNWHTEGTQYNFPEGNWDEWC